MTHVVYSPAVIAAGAHYGVNARHLFNAISLGNSSTALTNATLWRSQARHIQATPDLMARAFQLGQLIWGSPESEERAEPVPEGSRPSPVADDIESTALGEYLADPPVRVWPRAPEVDYRSDMMEVPYPVADDVSGTPLGHHLLGLPEFMASGPQPLISIPAQALDSRLIIATI